MEVAASSQVQTQLVPPSSERMSPNVVARPISCGLSSGSRTPNEPGMPLLARATPEKKGDPSETATETTATIDSPTVEGPLGRARFTGEARIDSCHYARARPGADAQNRVRN